MKLLLVVLLLNYDFVRAHSEDLKMGYRIGGATLFYLRNAFLKRYEKVLKIFIVCYNKIINGERKG